MSRGRGLEDPLQSTHLLQVAATAHLLLWEVQDGVQPLAVLLPGLLLVDLVPLRLWQGQEPSDSAQVFPEGPVVGTRAFLPPEELTQPALEHEYQNDQSIRGEN